MNARNWIGLFVIAVCARPVAAGELKSTKIALFNSGVGYFEAANTVEGDATAELTFRVDQVDDILKSLVLRDLDGGTVAAVQYPSRDPIDKTLRSFGVDITGKPSLAELLEQLRGVKVEVQATKAVVGSVFGVEKRKSITPQNTVIEHDVLTIMTDGGLKSFDLSEVAGVKILDAKVEGELNKALATVALSHDADKKAVTLNFSGQGKRHVVVSYILETPVWKTSYRLGLMKGKKPFLQGWALVDNATEQDWEGVNLSLVSGRPISFAMDLYQPFYIPRPVEQLALYGSIRPPNIEAAIAGLPVPAAKAKRDGRMYFDARNASNNSQGGGGKFAFGGGQAQAEAKDEEQVNAFRPEETGVSSIAAAQSAGELFEYSIKAPVTLKRQQSAMLPIVTEEIDGQKLSVWNPSTHPKHPLNAIKLKNTSKLFLMQGPVTVFDGGVYAGDAKLPDLRADEERMIGYALDLATEVDVKHAFKPDEITQVRIAKGTMILERKFVDERTYSVRNKGEAAKTVILEQPIGDDWVLVEPKEPFERASKLLRFKMSVAAGETQSLMVRLENLRDDLIVLSNLEGEQIEIYLRMKVVGAKVRAALERLLQLRRDRDATRRHMEQLSEQVKTIAEEQSRIRENMKVLSQNSDVYRRYEKKFDDEETAIEGLRKEVEGAKKQVDEKTQAIEEFLLGLDLS